MTTEDRGRYRPRLIGDVPQKRGEFHPSEVTAIVDGRGNGWVPAFSGIVYSKNQHQRPSHGDLAGCLTYSRRNVDSPSSKKPFVRTFSTPIKVAMAHRRALGKNIDEEVGLADSVERVEKLHGLLGDWLDLTLEERAQLEAGERRPVDLFLAGSIDATKRQIYGQISSMIEITDKTGRHNPSAARARLVVAGRLLPKRQAAVIKSRAAILSRQDWAESMLVRSQFETMELRRFFAEREILPAKDVDEFFELARDTLNPLCQLVGYICWELKQRGDRIEDSSVIKTVLDALEFHRYYGYLLEPTQRLAAKSQRRLQADRARYSAVILPQLRQRSRFLRDLRVGGPYDELTYQLHLCLQELMAAFERSDWAQVKLLARTFNYSLMFRSSKSDPAPAIWYGVTPPNSEPETIADRLNGVTPPSKMMSEETDALFDSFRPRR